MIDYLINGVSLRTTVGFRAESGRRHAGQNQDNTVVLLEGVPGGFFARSGIGTRLVQFTGHLVHTTASARLTAEDELKRLLDLQDFTLGYTRADTATRNLTPCRLRGEVDIQPTPNLNSRVARVAFTIEAQDPRWYESSATTVTLSATATPFNVALGTADSDFVLTIVGAATNPTVTLKDGTGATVAVLTFTITVAGGDSLIINSRRSAIEKVVSAVTSNAADTLTAGGSLWPLKLKRSWYNGTTPPTITISAGAATSALVYTKRHW